MNKHVEITQCEKLENRLLYNAIHEFKTFFCYERNGRKIFNGLTQDYFLIFKFYVYSTK